MIDPEKVQKLCSHNVAPPREGRAPWSLDERESYERLKSAIRSGQKLLAKSIIEEGTPVNANRCLGGRRRITPLHLAVRLGCPNLVKTLLDYGASVNAPLIFETPIMLSVKLRRYCITDLLLTASDIKNSEEFSTFELSHFHIACLRGNTCVARKLIQLGANVNKAVKSESFFWSGYGPLHFAVESQSLELVQLLVDCGAIIKMTDARSYTPLHLAYERGSEAIIDILLTAHMYQLGNPTNPDGLSHFHIACTRNNVDVVEYFLNQGCDVNAMFKGNSLEYLECVPLELAIENECPDVAELLMLHGAKMMDPLCYESFLNKAYYTGNRRMIDILIQQLLSSRLENNKKRSTAQTMSDLHRAFMSSDRDKIDSSLLSPVLSPNVISDLNMPIWNGLTPLHVSVMCSFVECVKFLRVRNVNITMRDAKMRTPLHIAFESLSSSDFETVFEDLVDLDENPADSHGLTHFHIACTANKVDLVQRFIDRGGNIEHYVDDDSVKWPGYGPLHFATAFKRLDIVDVLLKQGIKLFTQRTGPTPLDIAISNLGIDCIFMHLHGDKEFKFVQRILSEAEKSGNATSSNCRGFSMLHVICVTQAEPDYEKLTNYVDCHPETINQVINYVGSEYHGYAPIHLAVLKRNDELIKWLLEKGTDIHLKDPKGFSPLQYDINNNGKYGIIEANPSVLCVPENPVDMHGNSYFHVGCVLGNMEIMQYYLRSGVDINLRTAIDVQGSFTDRTSLHLVIMEDASNVVDIVLYLLNNGASAIARDAHLNTPLHCIKHSSHPEIINELVNRGADVNSQNVFGQTPLHMICAFPGEISQTKGNIVTLLELGADINIQDGLGKTPLSDHYMLMDNDDEFEECAVILLKHAKKLEVLGRDLSDENREARTELFENWTVEQYREQEFIEQCWKEIDRMKSTKTDRYTTVFEILSKSPNQMANYCKNSSFREIIEPDELNKKFPIYGYLLKLQYKVGLVRKPLLEKCKMLLSRSNGLPLQLSEIIFEHLDDNDLKNIIKSVELISNDS